MPADKKDKNKKRSARAPAVKVPMSERLSNYICPMLLGGVICFSIVYALYRPAAYLCTVGFLAAEFLLFSLFDRLKQRPIAGGLLYTVMLFVAEMAAMYLMATGAYSSGFMSPVTWFYGEEGSYSSQPLYLAAIMIGGGFFMISILYYFTQIRYRSLGSMLCILFPFVIYAKRAEEIPEIVVTLIVTMFIAVMVHNRRLDPSVPKASRGVLSINMSYTISIAVFVTITGAATMMIDKPTHMSELEKNANFFNYYPTGIGAGNYNELGNSSSQRYGGGRGSNDPLFYFETDGNEEEYYLRSTHYDNFNGEVWERTTLQDDYSYIYSSVLPEYSYDDIIADMDVIIKDAGGVGGVKSISGSIPVKTGRLYDVTFNPSYLPAPYGTVTDNGTLSELEYRKYYQGVIVRRSAAVSDTPPALNDTISFMEPGDSYYEYAGALGLTGDEYLDLLLDDYSDEATRLYSVSAARTGYS